MEALKPVFVYGTLKKGQPNNFLLSDKANGHAKFLGRAKLTSKYPLVVGSESNVPMLLPEKGIGKVVEGELYQVDGPMLKVLDKLECHPELYIRTDIDCLLITDESGCPSSDAVIMKTQVYFLPNFKPALLNLPYLDDYKDSKEKPYCPHDRRSFSLLDEVKVCQT